MKAPAPPAAYVVRVSGHLDPHWSARFPGLDLVHDTDGTTTLTGAVADQAALHGILARVRDLGVTLISVTPSGSCGAAPDAPARHRTCACAYIR